MSAVEHGRLRRQAPPPQDSCEMALVADHRFTAGFADGSTTLAASLLVREQTGWLGSCVACLPPPPPTHRSLTSWTLTKFIGVPLSMEIHEHLIILDFKSKE